MYADTAFYFSALLLLSGTMFTALVVLHNILKPFVVLESLASKALLPDLLQQASRKLWKCVGHIGAAGLLTSTNHHQQ